MNHPSKSKKKSTSDQSATEAERWLHDKHSWDDPAESADGHVGSAEHPSLAADKVQQAYTLTGLESDSEAEEEQVDQHHLQQQKKQKGKAKQGQKRDANPSPSNPFDSLVRPKQKDGVASGQTAAATENLMSSDVEQSADADRLDTEAGASGEGHRADPVLPFDYAAARAKAPGLEMSLGPAETGGGRRGGRGRGRGRGRDGSRGGRDGGRGGRGRGMLQFLHYASTFITMANFHCVLYKNIEHLHETNCANPVSIVSPSSFEGLRDAHLHACNTHRCVSCIAADCCACARVPQCLLGPSCR